MSNMIDMRGDIPRQLKAFYIVLDQIRESGVVPPVLYDPFLPPNTTCVETGYDGAVVEFRASSEADRDAIETMLQNVANVAGGSNHE